MRPNVPSSTLSGERATEEALLQKELVVLGQIIRRIPGKCKLDDAVQDIMNEAHGYMGVDILILALVDNVTRSVNPWWMSHLPYSEFRAQGKGVIRLDDEGDILIQCLRQRKPLVSNDPENDPRVNPIPVRITKTKAFALLPLIVDGQAIGTLGFSNLDPDRKIGLTDVEKFQRFVDTLSLFFHNARLYESLEEWNHTLEQRVEEKVGQLQTAHATIFEIKEYLSGIVENTTTGIIATDPRGGLTIYNRSAAAIFHGSMASVPGGTISALFPPGEFADLLTSLAPETAPSKGTEPTGQLVLRNVERQMRCVDGTPVPVNLSVVRLWTRTGDFLGFQFIIHDLREIRFLENQIMQGEKLKTLGEMAAGISHEINTPLGIIKGSLAVLKTTLGPPPPLVEKHLGIIGDAVERGVHFIREILTLSRPSPPQFRRLAPSELVTQAIEVISLKYAHRSVRIMAEIEPNVPHLYGDYHKLHQVLFILIDNAVEASGLEGEIRVQVGTTSAVPADVGAMPRRREDPPNPDIHLFRRRGTPPPNRLLPIIRVGDPLVAITVADDGLGMSADIQQRLFNPFFSTKHQTGTGLGLAIALSIVQRHHGSISVVSDLGKGTRMIMKFPPFDQVIHFERMSHGTL